MNTLNRFFLVLPLQAILLAVVLLAPAQAAEVEVADEGASTVIPEFGGVRNMDC